MTGCEMGASGGPAVTMWAARYESCWGGWRDGFSASGPLGSVACLTDRPGPVWLCFTRDMNGTVSRLDAVVLDVAGLDAAEVLRLIDAVAA